MDATGNELKFHSIMVGSPSSWDQNTTTDDNKTEWKVTERNTVNRTGESQVIKTADVILRWTEEGKRKIWRKGSSGDEWGKREGRRSGVGGVVRKGMGW